MAIAYEVKPNNDDTSGSTVTEADIVLTASRGYTIAVTGAAGIDLTSTQVKQECQSLTPPNNLPKEGASHPFNPYLFARRIDVEKVSIAFYTASVEYESEPFREGEENLPPTDIPARIRFGSITTEEQIDEDLNGNPLVNAGTGEPIQGITIPITDQVITIEKNLATFDPVAFYAYYNRVNNDTYPIGSGYPPGVLRIIDISAGEELAESSPYYKLTVKIQARKPYKTTDDKAWYKRIKKQGYMVFSGILTPGGEPIIGRATDEFGDPVGTPVLLKADGTRVPEGDPAHYDEWEVFESIPFASMGLLP